MTENSDLYTDYALQMFSSFVKGDIQATETMFNSFRNEGKATDAAFMPGLIYGLIYHMDNLMAAISDFMNVDIETFLSHYALIYANERENLIGQTLFDVSMAKKAIEAMDKAKEQEIILGREFLNDYENMTEDEKNEFAKRMLKEIFGDSSGEEDI